MRLVTLSIVSAGLLLSGCVPPPAPYGNPYAPAYAPPQADYALPGQPYVGPDGLTYVDGYPVDTSDGYQAAYVFVPTLGGWGFYDREHRWRGAPPGMRERLERAHPGGRGIPPGEFRGGRPGPGFGGGAPQGRPGGFPGRPGGPPPGGPPPGALVGRPGPGPAGFPGHPGPGGPPPGRPGGAPPPGRPPAPPPRPAPPAHNCPPGQPRC